MSAQGPSSEIPPEQVAAAVGVAAFLWSPLAGAIAVVASRVGGLAWVKWVAVGAVLAWARLFRLGVQPVLEAHVGWHRHIGEVWLADDYPALVDVDLWWAMLRVHVWLAPLAGGLAAGAIRGLTRERKPAGKDKSVSRPKRRVRRRLPAVRWGRPVLGAYVDGDLGEGWRGRRWVRGGLVCPPEKALAVPIGVVGVPGVGKTQALVSLAECAWRRQWSVHYLDCKGSPKLPAMFTAAALGCGVDADEIRLWPADRFDVWRGPPASIADRLLACLSYSEQYFEDVAGALVRDVCRGPQCPRSAAALLRRLGERADELHGLDRDHARTAVRRFQALFAAVEADSGMVWSSERHASRRYDTLFDGGWAWEDSRASLVTMRGLGAEKHTAAAARLLLADVAHWAAARKDLHRALLVVDEAGVVGADALVDLVERVRECGVGVALSAQTAAGLGERAAAVFEACGTLIVMRSSNPRQVADLAGTVPDGRRSWQVSGERFTGSGMLAETGRRRVDLDRVRQLRAGEAVVIHAGRSAWTRLRQPSSKRLAEAEALVKARQTAVEVPVEPVKAEGVPTL